MILNSQKTDRKVVSDIPNYAEETWKRSFTAPEGSENADFPF